MIQIIFYIKDNGFILQLEREVVWFPPVDVVKKIIEGEADLWDTKMR